MIKDITISILTGIVISQHFNPPDTPARLAIILIVAVTVFTLILELEDLWDKRQEITQRAHTVTAAIGRHIHTVRRRIYSRIIWQMIQLRAWPTERAQRRRRYQTLQGYIQRLREMEREQSQESEVQKSWKRQRQ